MITTFTSKRSIYIACALGAAFLLAMAYYFQYVQHLEPCPLCITQRFFVLLIGIVATIAALHNSEKKIRLLYPSLIILFAAAGAFFAGRMVWLQSLPEDQVPACGPSLEYILEAFPLSDALNVLLRGNGSCAEISWSLLGLSMPAWVMLAFSVYILLALWQILRR